MAFPASNGATLYTLEAAWAGARDAAYQIKSNALSLAALATTGAGAESFVWMPGWVSDYNAKLNAFAAVPGIVAYAQAQVADPSLDVAAAFGAMQQALIAVGNWIVSNFPKDASNNLLYIQFTSDGHLQYSAFTSAQLSGLLTLLNALIATID